jgi:hypothetical protein
MRCMMPAGKIDDPIIRHRPRAAPVRKRDLNLVIAGLELLWDRVFIVGRRARGSQQPRRGSRLLWRVGAARKRTELPPVKITKAVLFL